MGTKQEAERQAQECLGALMDGAAHLITNVVDLIGEEAARQWLSDVVTLYVATMDCEGEA
jgi:hypothetical protein